MSQLNPQGNTGHSRIRIRILGALVGGALLLIWCLPFLLSTSLSRDYMTNRVFGDWNGRVSVKSFSVGWIRPLQIDNVVAHYEGKQVLQIESIETDLPFTNLLSQSSDPESYKVRGLHLVLEQDGRSSVEKLIPIDCDANCRVEIHDAEIDLVGATGESIALLHDIDVVLQFGKVAGVPTFAILPTQLLDREPMKLELRKHVPDVSRPLFESKYTEGIVTMRLIEYSEIIGAASGVTSTTEIVVHDLNFSNQARKRAATAFLRAAAQMPDDSPDIAIIRVENRRGEKTLSMVNKSQLIVERASQ